MGKNPTSITIGTEYRRAETNNEMQVLRAGNTDQEEANNGETNQRKVQNALEFADDTQLFIENGTEEQMNERIGNYDIVTETRRLTIQWKSRITPIGNQQTQI